MAYGTISIQIKNGKIVTATAFFDTIDLEDIWNRFATKINDIATPVELIKSIAYINN